MYAKKDAYFYNKLENKPKTEYKDGWHKWYFEYFIEPVHVLDGDGNDIVAHPGEFYLVPPYNRMYFNYDTPFFTHTSCVFDADEEFMARLSIPYMMPIEIKNKSGFEMLLHLLEEAQRSNSDMSKEEQDMYLSLVLMFVHDQVTDKGMVYRFNSADVLHSTHNTVMNSLAIDWSVEMMAHTAKMSVSTFIRQYKRLYGKTPMADLYDARFKHAKRLLDTGYSISWVLNSCCFKSNQHFSHFFKNRTGISPSEYLKLKKK